VRRTRTQTTGWRSKGRDHRESSGALSLDTVRLIRRLATHVATPEGHDATAHGLSRSSPQSFYRHRHILRHCGVLMLVVRAQAESYAFMLTLDVRRI
jgi:hypothetical protein